LENAGGMVALNSPVWPVSVGSDGIALLAADGLRLQARTVINAAGLQAVSWAGQLQGLDAATLPTAYYCKGNYFTLAGRSPFSRLIYPVPQAAGLGVHLTLDMGGQAKFGPDVEWVGSADDLTVDATRGEAFYEAVRQYWPDLKNGALIPGYCGIRPKINAPHEAARDFMIQGPADHGAPGLVNLFGIESPGLTSALAIGEHVVELLQVP
jgi:L-2-hydroxyglutarate oxidase LhgO